MVHGLWRSCLGGQHCAKVRKRSCPSNFLVKKWGLTVSSAMHVMEVQRERKQDVIKPLYGLVPYFVTWTFIPAYLYLQPIILEYHLIPFVFYVGLINAYSVGLMIVAHLTQDPTFPMYNVLTIPLGLAVLDSAGPFLGLWPSALGNGTYQIAFVFMWVGFGFGVYGSFVVSRCPEISVFILINFSTTSLPQSVIILTFGA